MPVGRRGTLASESMVSHKCVQRCSVALVVRHAICTHGWVYARHTKKERVSSSDFRLSYSMLVLDADFINETLALMKIVPNFLRDTCVWKHLGLVM